MKITNLDDALFFIKRENGRWLKNSIWKQVENRLEIPEPILYNRNINQESKDYNKDDDKNHRGRK